MSYITPNGKEIDIIIEPVRATFKVQFKTGGELPETLSGFYTSFKEAEKAVLSYIASKTNEQVETNGKSRGKAV